MSYFLQAALGSPDLLKGTLCTPARDQGIRAKTLRRGTVVVELECLYAATQANCAKTLRREQNSNEQNSSERLTGNWRPFGDQSDVCESPNLGPVAK